LPFPVAPGAPDQLGGFIAGEPAFASGCLRRQCDADHAIAETFLAVKVDRRAQDAQFLAGRRHAAARFHIVAAQLTVDLGQRFAAEETQQPFNALKGFLGPSVRRNDYAGIKR